MNTPNRISPNLFAALLKKHPPAKQESSNVVSLAPIIPEPIIPPQVAPATSGINYNSKQSEAISLITSGRDCVILGAAGTGKTTTQRGAMNALVQSGRAGILEPEDHKYLKRGTPGIVIIAFTRRAVNNIRRVVSSDMQHNCITHHKLLEYEPEYYDVYDEASGETKTTMRFSPTRHRFRPLPPSISTILIEESSMYSRDPMFKELMEACPHKPQVIFIGDIQQLPPVFGSAILGYKMLECPVVELTEVYRQALDSPIIRLAHRILSGKPLLANEFPLYEEPGKLHFHMWKKKISAFHACQKLGRDFFPSQYDAGLYNPDTDMILIPFNVGCGTDDLNKYIASHIARRKSRLVYEVIAGFNKAYFAVGDKVLYDKEDAEVLEIVPNESYVGKRPHPASLHLDYFGMIDDPSAEQSPEGESEEDTDRYLELLANADSEETSRQASHKITLSLRDSERVVTIYTVGDVSSLLLRYALTVHKSQGSEWRKVYCCFHNSHAPMMQRELLYTAVTRAREFLYFIGEPETLDKGIRSQKIRGNTLAEKAAFFQGKVDSQTNLSQSRSK
jgi:exodeoxyribonuclease V alpha subunit